MAQQAVPIRPCVLGVRLPNAGAYVPRHHHGPLVELELLENPLRTVSHRSVPALQTHGGGKSALARPPDFLG